MGTGQSKEISKANPLGCTLAHWRELVGYKGIENKRNLVKFCAQWWLLYKLGECIQWPPTGSLDFETLWQLMLFLRREEKWEEVTYADLFFSLQNHPEWQRSCGIKPPSDPFVLALEKNKANRGKPKHCCDACSINQRCTQPDKVYHAEKQEQELTDLLRPPPKRQGRQIEETGLRELPHLNPTSAPLEKKKTEQPTPSHAKSPYPCSSDSDDDPSSPGSPPPQSSPVATQIRS